MRRRLNEEASISTLLIIDSFDHYSISQGSRKWTAYGGGTLVTGRTGQALQAGGATGTPTKTFGPEYATLTQGVAYNTTAFGNPIFGFSNVAHTELKCYLRHVGDGRLYFTVELPGFFGANSPMSTFVMNVNQWYYIECQMALTGGPPTLTLHATARVNGTEILDWTTSNSAGSVVKFATISLGAPGGGFTAKFDDFYCTDDEYLGDVRIGVLYPNAPGDSAAWTPNGAGANWEKTKEHPADDDTTYVSAATAGLVDLYNLDDIDPAFSGTIKGAQALWLTKKSDEGAATIRGQWKSSGSVIDGPDFDPSATSYIYSIQPARKSLFTGSDWVASEVNALQIGVKRTV